MRAQTPFSMLVLAGLVAGCVETVTPAVTIAPTATDRQSVAYQACLRAIATTTGNSTADIAVYDYVTSEAGVQMMATVAGATAPWQCIASNGGVVQNVMFTGDEGAL